MLVTFENVTFGYIGVPVVRDVSFTIHEKERVGLLGGNGEGKTTLLKLLTGDLTPDAGSVIRKSALQLGYLEQSGGFSSDATVYGAMEEIFEEDKQLIARLRDTEQQMATADENEMRVLAARVESLNRRIAARDSYHFDVRIRTVLGGMGFGSMFSQKVSTMSGGERTKLKLCRLLLEEPELLILDEPTNHLDVSTLFWLEDYLASYKGALLLVSHDRYFLDRLTTRTLELERGVLTSYKGGYSQYRVLREEKRKEEERLYEKQCEEIAKLQDFVDRHIVRATSASAAQSRVKQLERMERLEKPVPPKKPPRFRFTFVEQPYECILRAEHFDLKADEKLLLRDASFTLMRGQKCALLGDNGTGKSTLLKYLLSGDGRIAVGRYVKIAYYDQENARLDPADRVLDAFWGVHRGLSQTEARALLAQAGLVAGDMDKTVAELSGGLKAKLALAMLEAERGNVLVLDEPTNHLDLPARESLEAALREFEGTILFVSHDRRFVEAVANSVVVIEGSALHPFAGGYQDYLAWQKVQKTQDVPRESAPKAAGDGYRSREERAREAQRRNRVRAIEQELAALEEEDAALAEELLSCGRDYVRAQQIAARQTEIAAKSDQLYEEYGTLIE